MALFPDWYGAKVAANHSLYEPLIVSCSWPGKAIKKKKKKRKTLLNIADSLGAVL